MKRRVQSLNGYWKYSVNGLPQAPVKVPFSALCAGDSQCDLVFDAQCLPDEYVQLCFEGITYRAQVLLNGEMLGEMGPYSRYLFDVTHIIKPAQNHLCVRLQDMNMPFGPSEGWENYGGIIRDVYLTYMNRIHVEDIVWRTRTRPPYSEAECTVEVQVSGADTCDVAARLQRVDGEEIDTVCGIAENGAAHLTFHVKKPALWSPDVPNLYSLTVRAAEDELIQTVGIKDFRIVGQRFFLNGKPIFLKGLNRHDMWGDQGYTLTREQMEQDMYMIKATGCNYVRLVHYPHHPYILELADRIGLLVSEEPGLWWSDMHNPEVVSGALEVMRRVVLRDRNHCAVAFWLSFNECVFTPEFLEESSRLCRQLDPDRPVSGANAMDKEMTRSLYKQHGFDFYTRHPYTYNITQFKEEAAYLKDMPLVFTEWGGYFVFENGSLFEDSLREMIDAWKTADGGPVIAGCAYWCWADMYELGRGGLACKNGILHEGLVDIHRTPRSNLDRFTRIMRGFDVPLTAPSAIDVTCAEAKQASTLDIWEGIEETSQEEAWSAMLLEAAPQAGYTHKRTRRLTMGPILPDAPVEAGGWPVYIRGGKPLVVRPGQSLRIEVHAVSETVVFLGNVSLPWGYPVYGARGEVGAKYILHYSDGGEQEIPLRNGLELTTALGQQGPSRIRPVAPNVTQAVRWSYDTNWEHYVANLFEVQARTDAKIEFIEVISCHSACTLLLYAVSVKKPE